MSPVTAAELEFNAKVRKRTAKALALHLEGLGSEVWVPARVVRLAPREGPESFPHRAFLQRWWAVKDERVRHLLSKRVAGLPKKAGDFAAHPAPPRALLVPGPVEELVVMPLHDFAYTRARADLSVEETAALLGLSKSAVHGLESGTLTFTQEAMWERSMLAMEAEAERRSRIAARILEIDTRATAH
jgi:hypothetical protein